MLTLKFVKNVKADLSVDILHLMCPMHLLKLEEAIRKVEPAQIVEVVTDYDGALEDIPHWCEERGQEFIGVREDGEYFRFYIRRVR